ncbi:MAG: zinc-ribbon domain-containing protein [Oscillatoriales cyanobacterium SM2_1_8]|nr:zinc-ribbon domain-containing protein [Oscillatoriales cyanobacterium SM2_1_8]
MECPHCGHLNPESNRFCNHCGQSLLSIPAPGPTVAVAIAEEEEATAFEEPAAATELAEEREDSDGIATALGDGAPLLDRLERAGEAIDAGGPPTLVEETAAPAGDGFPAPTLTAAGHSDPGPQRANNEDHYGVFCRWQTAETLTVEEHRQARGFFVVCDGMGGPCGGGKWPAPWP